MSLADGTHVNNPEDDPNGIFLSGNLPPISSTSVHTMQDVGIFASGPDSDAVKGIIDNTEIYHIIASALGFGTNGEISKPDIAMKKCMNSGKNCNCQIVKGSHNCSCLQGGPTVYVKGGAMCSIVNGTAKPMM